VEKLTFATMQWIDTLKMVPKLLKLKGIGDQLALIYDSAYTKTTKKYTYKEL
jgi:hypothetical protein